MDRRPAPLVTLASEQLIHLSISRPKRPMPRPAGAAALKTSQEKRFATILPSRAGDSSGTSESSSVSLQTTTTTSSIPRRRKLSRAEDVVARTRAKWARETLSRSETTSVSASVRPTVPEQEDKENTPFQRKPFQDANEKPLPPRPTLSVQPSQTPALLAPPVTPVVTFPTVTFVREAVEQRRESRTIPLTSPQITRRQSNVDELETSKDEATVMMIHAARADGTIPCQRPDCPDILKNVRALMFHLHLHDIDQATPPRGFVCADCAGCYESPRELSMHDCERHRSSVGVLPSSGPLKDRFKRIVYGWNCLYDTSNL